MCGGLREMQSRRPPRRFHEGLKPNTPIAADCLLINVHQPAPCGLAIVAALEPELVQSGRNTTQSKAAESVVPSSTSSLPIPIAAASDDHFPAYRNKRSDQGDGRSIFSTSLSPPGSYRELYDDFLGVCFCCQRPLAPGKDVYIYRGDRAFCSIECRHKHIAIEESLLSNIQINQQCVQASSPTSRPKFRSPVAILV